MNEGIQQERRCSNCDKVLAGEICSQCGQRDMDLERPFRELLVEWLGAIAAFDTRLISTLKPLLTRPGFLTLEYVSGRRARFVNPLKLYFTISLLLFVAMSFTKQEVVKVTTDGDQVITQDGVIAGEEDSDSASTVQDAGEDPEKEYVWLSRALIRLGDVYSKDPQRFNDLFIDRLAKSVFLLVPLFALILRLLFRRSRYIVHLVFSLHLHSFAFLVLLIGVGFTVFGEKWRDAATGLSQLFIIVYTWFGLRRVHQQGRLITALKMGIMGFGYLFLLLVTMVLTVALTVMTY